MAQAKDTDDKKLREEALAWFVKLNSGHATKADHDEHASWLMESDRNAHQYARVDGVWSDMDRIADPRKRSPQGSTTRQSLSRPLSRRNFIAGGALAASSAGFVVLNGPPDFLFSDYYTGVGELRSITLPDGTRMELDADTAVNLDFSKHERRLRLPRGRAFFDVVSDTTRPFVVEASGGAATALGTRFTVHQWDDTVTVSVEESAVSVSAPDSTIARLGEGEYISYGKNGLDQIGAVDPETGAAWRHGRLIFEDRPLRQVIADVNRYRSGTIYITDGRLLDLRVSGIFDIENPDGVLDVIRDTLPVRVVELTRYLVLLRPVG